MCQGLSEAVESLEIGAGGDALVGVLADADRLESKICAAVGAFDADGLYELDGATSAQAWLRSRCRLSSARAASLVRWSKRLRKLPVCAEAWGDGSLSSSQVAVVMANLANDEVADLFVEHEAEVVPALVPLSVPDTTRAMQAWAAAAAAILDDPDPDEPDRILHLSRTFEGRGELKGSFDVEGLELVAKALNLSMTKDVEGEPARSPARRRADAMVDLCRWFLDHQQTKLGGRHRPHLNVVINWDLFDNLDNGAMGRILDGAPLDAITINRLLCDAGLHRMVLKGISTVLDYGRTTYTIPASLWAALGIRDEHCRFPGSAGLVVNPRAKLRRGGHDS